MYINYIHDFGKELWKPRLLCLQVKPMMMKHLFDNVECTNAKHNVVLDLIVFAKIINIYLLENPYSQSLSCKSWAVLWYKSLPITNTIDIGIGGMSAIETTVMQICAHNKHTSYKKMWYECQWQNSPYNLINSNKAPFNIQLRKVVSLNIKK